MLQRNSAESPRSTEKKQEWKTKTKKSSRVSRSIRKTTTEQWYSQVGASRRRQKHERRNLSKFQCHKFLHRTCEWRPVSASTFIIKALDNFEAWKPVFEMFFLAAPRFQCFSHSLDRSAFRLRNSSIQLQVEIVKFHFSFLRRLLLQCFQWKSFSAQTHERKTTPSSSSSK